MSSIVEANNRGVSIFKNGSSVPSWSFGQSFFFASTVVTTIGKEGGFLLACRPNWIYITWASYLLK